MNSITEDLDEVTVRANWVVPASRRSVFAIASDFESFAVHFPKLARSTHITSQAGDHLVVEVLAASFGRFFPSVRVTINVELLPGTGYRCSTHNHTFSTTGREELLLSDTPIGTQITYTYVVKVGRRWFRPLYGWLARRFGLPFWKRNYLDPLTRLAQDHEHAALAERATET